MEEKIPESDQWKLYGNCAKCRREKYCTKTCKANKQRTDAILREMIGTALARRMMKKS